MNYNHEAEYVHEALGFKTADEFGKYREDTLKPVEEILLDNNPSASKDVEFTLNLLGLEHRPENKCKVFNILRAIELRDEKINAIKGLLRGLKE